MKWMLAALLAVTSLVPLSAVHAQSVRHGTIVDMQPIDNRGKDETADHKEGRKFGALFGNILGVKTAEATGSSTVANAVANVAPRAGEQAGGAIVGEGPSAHYMVKLQMDDGKVMSTVQSGQAVHALAVGSKVAVSGSGGSVTLAAE